MEALGASYIDKQLSTILRDENSYITTPEMTSCARSILCLNLLYIIFQLKVLFNKIDYTYKNYGKINEQVNQMEFQMSKLFLTQHLNKVFSHMEKMDVIKAASSAIKENEVFKLRQDVVAKERIAQDQMRQERIIQEQTTLRVEQERIALEKLNLKADQEALQKRQEIITQIKDGIVSAKVNIQKELKEEREQLDKEKAQHEHLTSSIMINELNEILDEVSLLGDNVD